jgi:hypothetical protein
MCVCACVFRCEQHIKFRKDWAQLTFRLSDVHEHLQTCATIVVFIRAVLDTFAPGFKMRQTIGSSHEFLWQLQQTGKALAFDTADDIARFVCPIVHWSDTHTLLAFCLRSVPCSDVITVSLCYVGVLLWCVALCGRYRCTGRFVI